MATSTNLGRVMPVDKGTYRASVTYSKLDMVHTSDSTYVSKVDNNIGHAVTDTAYWVCYANGKQATAAAEASAAQRAADHEIYGQDHEQALQDQASFDNFTSGTYPNFTAGDIVPKITAPIPSMQKYAIQTTGGDEDILSGNSLLDSIKGNLDDDLNPFIADSFVSTDMNQVDSSKYLTINSKKAYYFPVVAGAWGAWGTTEENNGFKVISESTPDGVYFSATKPTASAYGSACAYHEYNGIKYYTPATVGWMTIIMPDNTVPACHIEWSGKYENVGGNFANVVKAIGTALQAVHSWGLSGIVGADRSSFDELDFVAAKGYARNDRDLLKNLVWSMTTYTDNQESENPVTHYVFKATISGMALNGLWRCNHAGIVMESTTAIIDSTTITTVEDLVASFGNTEYIYFEKASVVSSNIANAAAIRANTVNDFGLSYFMYNGELVSVPAYVTEEFYQGGKDFIWNNLTYLLGELSETVAPALCDLDSRLSSVVLKLKTELADMLVLSVGGKRRTLNNFVGLFKIKTSDSPITLGIVPMFVGQECYDTTNKIKYEAFGISSASDWVALNS